MKTLLGSALLLLILCALVLTERRGSEASDIAAEAPPVEELILPFREDAPHILTRAYHNESHRKYADSDERFAADFAAPGCAGFRSEVIAPLSGRVSIGDPSGGRGKNVLIAREDGLTCRLAHLDEILVSDGAEVSQGETVALEGNSGGVTGTKCAEHPGTHIHLACYRDGEGVKPEPISGYSNLDRLVSRSLTAHPLPSLADARSPRGREARY